MKRIQMKNSNERTIAVAFEEFIKDCKVRNLSPRTIKYYYDYMAQFTKFLNTRQIVNTKEIKYQVVDDFILALKDSNSYKDITINTSLRAVRAIVYFFQMRGYTEEFKIRLLKTDKEMKEPYTQKELRLLLNKTKTNEFSEYRNWVIVNFLLATGVRIGELVSLQVKDIDFDEAIVKVKRGKSRRERHIPLAKTLMKILTQYLSIRQPSNECDELFCNAFGKRLHEDGCQHAIASYNIKRGVTKTSVHLFRHTFAKMFILNGGDVFRLQKILGHKSLDIVKEYVSMFSNDLQQDFDLFNPLEQLTESKTEIRIK